jgi:glycosyltransferase involved in cell wall biosynthesis
MHCDYGTASPPASMAEKLTAPRHHERVRFGFLSTFLHDKGAHVLIDAFSRLPEGYAELHLFGKTVDPPYYQELQRRARHPDIHWRGALAHADRWQALADIDVLVVPSIWHENSPLTIHEAHTAGVPVIGSAAGGIPELVQDGVTGLTFPIGDAGALAEKLRATVENRTQITRWREAIVPPKSMETHTDEIEALYREICNSRQRSVGKLRRSPA